MQVLCKTVINAAGLQAQAVARSIAGIPAATIPPTYYAIGHYYTLAGATPFSRLVYPVARQDWLGVHVTVDLGAGTATGGDTLSGVENVTGSQFADTITGGPGVNVLVCLGGTDTVSAELADSVAADCENVTRSDGSGGGDTGGGTGGGGSGGGTPAPGPGTTAPGAPVLSGLTVKSMRTGKRGTFTYSLDKAAATTITLARMQKGRKVGRACKKQTRKNRKKRSCTMFVTVGKLTQSGAAGRNTLTFSGKLGGRKLAPGIYRATAVATNSGGASKPVMAKFVVRR